ncbi:MAG TPA: hypothetical protein VGO52_19980 [Hyphomonadaceae bacterium]|jgi:hypothetical protein|nr:hypothetical protein [Hyphomonadaceae bacterium]
MTKATDLPALFARLLKIREAAPVAAEKMLADMSGREAQIGKLHLTFYNSWGMTMTGELMPPKSNIQVHDGEQSVFLACFPVGNPGDVKFSKWKRGPWEETIAKAVSAVNDEEARERSAAVAREPARQSGEINETEKRLHGRGLELVMKRHDRSFESRQQ